MIEPARKSLESSGASISALARSLTTAERDFRPKESAWSAHDVVCHLLDEEREDFRQRLRLVLEDPQAEWPGIDPEGWPKSRNYAERDYEETLAAWERERAQSLSWLASLEGGTVPLDNAHTMPWGPLRAGDLVTSWVAHDLLHLRQLVARKFQYLAKTSAPYSTLYAGEW
ncbi:MAG: DinB family protein [Candidatus Eisenbacteria bacterium]|uniref:DinB family protein n=1 Tax=Eiseniibacteriota bacterium TaxID=2212470 RepID=A0A956NBH9_UNCEI|nr:DinB family protein [Candidatus Eisenbacteria bacterium]